MGAYDLSIQVSGAKELATRAGALLGRARSGPRGFIDVDRLAAFALATAEKHSPVLTGAFRDAWSVTAQGNSWNDPLFTLENDDPAAQAIEYGTSKSRPHFTLRTTIREVQDNLARFFRTN